MVFCRQHGLVSDREKRGYCCVCNQKRFSLGKAFRTLVILSVLGTGGGYLWQNHLAKVEAKQIALTSIDPSWAKIYKLVEMMDNKTKLEGFKELVEQEKSNLGKLTLSQVSLFIDMMDGICSCGWPANLEKDVIMATYPYTIPDPVKVAEPKKKISSDDKSEAVAKAEKSK